MQFDPGPEHSCQFANEYPEVDPSFSGEKEGELVAIELVDSVYQFHFKGIAFEDVAIGLSGFFFL